MDVFPALLIPFALYVMVCIAFATYVAGEVGRTSGEAIMFGLFLGPFGVIAIACMPRLARYEPAYLPRATLPAQAPTPEPARVAPGRTAASAAPVVARSPAQAPAPQAQPRPAIPRKPAGT